MHARSRFARLLQFGCTACVTARSRGACKFFTCKFQHESLKVWHGCHVSHVMHERRIANMHAIVCMSCTLTCIICMGESIKEGRKKEKGFDQWRKKLCTNQEINKEKIRYPVGDVSCLSNLKWSVQSQSQSILNTFSLKLVQLRILPVQDPCGSASRSAHSDGFFTI